VNRPVAYQFGDISSLGMLYSSSHEKWECTFLEDGQNSAVRSDVRPVLQFHGENLGVHKMLPLRRLDNDAGFLFKPRQFVDCQQPFLSQVTQEGVQ
jgi:hypothetical protein